MRCNRIYSPSYSLEREQHNYCLDDEQTKCAECIAGERRKGQASSACASPRKQGTVTVKGRGGRLSPLSSYSVWLGEPSLQLLKCNGVYQQLEAVIIDVSWMLLVLWVRLPVLYLWKHICLTVLSSVAKNITRALKYLLLICLVSAKFQLDTVFWTIEWHRLAMNLKTDFLVFCVPLILLKQLTFQYKKAVID